MYTRRAAVNPLVIFVIAVIVGALILTLAGTTIFRSAAHRAKTRESERQSMREFLGEAKKLTQGGKIEKMPNFPDSPIGRMQRVVFTWAKQGQDRSAAMMKELGDMGWDWVGSPESLRTPEALQKCLDTVPKARSAVQRLLDWMQTGYSRMLVEVEAQSDGSADSRSFLAGLKASSSDRNSGYELGLETWRTLQKNMDALAEMLRFLKARSGKYTVAEDGGIEFSSSVPQKDRDAYDGIVDRVNGYLKQVQTLEERRIELAKQQLEKANKDLSK